MLDNSKVAFVTGFTGQDGTFLTDLLLKKHYKVVALTRRVSTEPPIRARGDFDFSSYIESGHLSFETGDLLSVDSLIRIIKKWQPHEIYNLAAQSDVHISFMQPEFTTETDYIGVMNLITALEAVGRDGWRMYQASTSEMFGDQKEQMDENTTLMPNSPYAIAKAAAHYYCQYKRHQGRFISCGILFNHESEIRGGNFVTQKIVRAVVEWSKTGKTIELGNLDSVRDWGFAGDYVNAMWRMLQHDTPDDYVVGTGITHTVKEFIEAAFKAIGINSNDIIYTGTGETTKIHVEGKLFAEVTPKFWRPVDVRYLHADADKANRLLDWKPEVSFEQLVARMVKAEVEHGPGR